jgi:hypothetical protein
MSSSFTYQKRAFLNPTDISLTSYILAQVEADPHGANVLVIADCRRTIHLEFYLGNSDAAKESFAKIDLMIEVLIGFRDALKAAKKKRK